MAEAKDRNGLTKSQKRRARRKRAKERRNAAPSKKKMSMKEAQDAFSTTVNDALAVARLAGVPIPDEVTPMQILKELRKKGIKKELTEQGIKAGMIPRPGRKTAAAGGTRMLRYRGHK